MHDFASPDDLAKLLITLWDNEDLYRSFFDWRQPGQTVLSAALCDSPSSAVSSLSVCCVVLCEQAGLCGRSSCTPRTTTW